MNSLMETVTGSSISSLANRENHFLCFRLIFLFHLINWFFIHLGSFNFGSAFCSPSWLLMKWFEKQITMLSRSQIVEAIISYVIDSSRLCRSLCSTRVIRSWWASWWRLESLRRERRFVCRAKGWVQANVRSGSHVPWKSLVCQNVRKNRVAVGSPPICKSKNISEGTEKNCLRSDEKTIETERKERKTRLR